MTAPLVTLTTDFGRESAYVAAMKGALLSVNPQARLLDLSHDIGPQDLRHASFFLRSCVPYFPAGTLHVVVVDPEVGTGRNILYVSVASTEAVLKSHDAFFGENLTSLSDPASFDFGTAVMTRSAAWPATFSGWPNKSKCW